MKGYIQWVGGAILFALIIISYSTCNSYKHNYEEQSDLISSMQDSIKLFKNKEGESVAQIALLQGSRDNLLKIIGNNDEKLAKLLKQKSNSGTAFNQTIKVDTVLITKVDTVDGIAERNSSLVDKWMNIQIKERDDILRAKIEMRDEVTVAFRDIRQGFLKPKKSVVEVTNANPYVKIDGVRSFEIPKKKTNTKLWVGIGVGVGAGYLFFK